MKEEDEESVVTQDEDENEEDEENQVESEDQEDDLNLETESNSQDLHLILRDPFIPSSDHHPTHSTSSSSIESLIDQLLLPSPSPSPSPLSSLTPSTQPRLAQSSTPRVIPSPTPPSFKTSSSKTFIPTKLPSPSHSNSNPLSIYPNSSSSPSPPQIPTSTTVSPISKTSTSSSALNRSSLFQSLPPTSSLTSVTRIPDRLKSSKPPSQNPLRLNPASNHIRPSKSSNRSIVTLSKSVHPPITPRSKPSVPTSKAPPSKQPAIDRSHRSRLSTRTPSKSRPLSPSNSTSTHSPQKPPPGLHPELAKSPIHSIQNVSPIHPSPQTSTKSSQAFREMLAKLKRQQSKPNTFTQQISEPDSVLRSETIPDDPNDALTAFGFIPVERAIEKAQRTGNLNLSSRMMSTIPSEIYHKLLSHTSIFHPSNRLSNDKKLTAKPVVTDLTFARDQSDSMIASGVAWYETVDIVHLNMSLNELTTLDEEFGGFEALTSCDLRCNQLVSLPPSFGLLTNLTILDLSSNQFVQFPLPIMSLVNLQELNLANNKLIALWPIDWKPSLKKQLATAVKPVTQDISSADQSFNSIDPASTITDSSFTQEESDDQFLPSSPKQSTWDHVDPPPWGDGQISIGSNREPLPALRKLKLQGNRFTANTLLGPDTVQLPQNLVELDLSRNPLGGRIEASSNLGKLKRLSKLNLSGCELQDEVFWIDFDGDYDQLDEGQENQKWWAQLTELDLSHNAIDSLECLEDFFERYGDPEIWLDYDGLSKELSDTIRHDRGSTRSLKVFVGNNLLRQESQRRHRIHKPVEPIKVGPKSDQTTGTELEVPRGHQLVEMNELENQAERLKLSGPSEVEQRNKLTVSLTASRSSDPTPTQAMLMKRYNKTTFALNLESLDLSTLSSDPQDYETLSRVELVNLANNRLTSMPLELMHSFGSHLTILNLSRNGLTSESIQSQLEATPDGLNLTMIHLPELIELNLSFNRLSRSPRSILNLIVRLECYRLKSLDLSFNRFSNLVGLYDFLKTFNDPDSSKEPNLGAEEEQENERVRGMKRSMRIERINFEGNQIDQIDDLVQLSTEIKASSSSPNHPNNLPGRGFKPMEEILLNDNSIAQLPPVLGHLPTLRLSVARNLFRFPLRKVYDCQDGDQKILTWLRERSD